MAAAPGVAAARAVVVPLVLRALQHHEEVVIDRKPSHRFGGGEELCA